MGTEALPVSEDFFVEWWLANRTDAQGWFHTVCSWESGQDGSKRFKVAGDNPGAVADMCIPAILKLQWLTR